VVESCRTWTTRAIEAGGAQAMKCSLCHYVSPPDGPTHNARTCPLRQTQCRRTLPVGHKFYEAGQCVSADCVHKQQCNTCGVPGHLYGTQALNTRRWKFNSKGALVLRAAGGGAGGGRSGGSVWSRGTDSSSTCYWVGGVCGIAAAGYWWPAYSTERPVGRLFHSSCCASGSVLFILCRLGAACLCLFSL